MRNPFKPTAGARPTLLVGREHSLDMFEGGLLADCRGESRSISMSSEMGQKGDASPVSQSRETPLNLGFRGSHSWRG